MMFIDYLTSINEVTTTHFYAWIENILKLYFQIMLSTLEYIIVCFFSIIALLHIATFYEY